MSQQFKEPQIKEESIMREKRLTKQHPNKSTTPPSTLPQFSKFPHSSRDSILQTRFDSSFPPKTKNNEEQDISPATTTLRATISSLQNLINHKKLQHERVTKQAKVQNSSNSLDFSKLEVRELFTPQWIDNKFSFIPSQTLSQIGMGDDHNHLQDIAMTSHEQNKVIDLT